MPPDEDPYELLIQDLSAHTGGTEEEVRDLLQEALEEVRRRNDTPNLFSNVWEAWWWLDFRACANAQYVMQAQHPEIYQEWRRWATGEFS